MQDIHRGKIVPKKNGQYYTLAEVSYIFVCPDCEYRWTALDKEGIATCRNVHNATVHPEKHLEVLHADALEFTKELFESFKRQTFQETVEALYG